MYLNIFAKLQKAHQRRLTICYEETICKYLAWLYIYNWKQNSTHKNEQNNLINSLTIINMISKMEVKTRII